MVIIGKDESRRRHVSIVNRTVEYMRFKEIIRMLEIHVVGAAIMDGGKVLAAQRSEKMNSPLKWEFVGGKVEQGESHHQALEREVFEELEVRIRAGDHIATGYSIFNGKKIVLHVYKAELIKGVPVLKEHARIRWVDIASLMELDWAEADIPACRELIKRENHYEYLRLF